MSDAASPTTTTKKHPIRGFLYGIVFGLGLALIAIGQGWAALGTKPPIIILIVGIIIGTLWSMFGPAKGPKAAAPPDPADPAPEPEPESDDDSVSLDTPPDAPLDTPLDTVDETS